MRPDPPPSRHLQQQQPLLVDRPIFHVAARCGWVNDPNAPFYWKGRYHLFYQHVTNSTSWTWGLCWGHVSSTDLIHWQHHPPAITPTPNTPDQDGCFSGCAAVVPVSALKRFMTAAASDRGGKQNLGQTSLGSDLNLQDLQLDWLKDREESQVSSEEVQQEVPVLLYTGVVKRSNAPDGLKTSSLSVSELCVERQMMAVPTDPDDPYLIRWTKVPQPWLSAPPQDLCLNCFRDPFVLEQPSSDNNDTWRVMIGAGVRDPGSGLTCAGYTTTSTAAADTEPSKPAKIVDSSVGGADNSNSSTGGDPRRAAKGTALVYKSHSLLSGWQFEGQLCTAVDGATDGVVWECPLIAELPLLTDQKTDAKVAGSNPGRHSHIFSVSVGSCPALYWLGNYNNGKFDLESAAGPYPLDLGDIMYAPNVLANSPCGVTLWSWVFELPSTSRCSHDYAGCLSLPRLLHITPEGHLHQQPLPQISLLHTGLEYACQKLELASGAVQHIGSTIPASYFDLQLTLVPQKEQPTAAAAAEPANAGAGSCVAGIALPSWSSRSRHVGSSTCSAGTTISGQGVVLLYDFNGSRLVALVGGDIGQDVVDHKVLPPAVLDKYCQPATIGSFGSQQPPQQEKQQQARSELGSDVRVVSGQLRLGSYEVVTLRVLMDYSLLEVFTSDGQVLSTRVYRGVWPGSSTCNGYSLNHRENSSAATATDQAAGANVGGVANGVPLSQGCCAADQAVPYGVFLFAASSDVVAQKIRMSAMRSAWVGDKQS